ncbi:hypothetical protein [Hyalangium rubrum]|uniref:Uncharacterized protein n=1 Tax=Hyalangium rubrum TaxID=3103134 RepID=A0ABU5GYK1_9BACT|nr:hypothetical protein [Hyalangium sp. s54d21]MDY7225583.1 hypothetical protein [Hyalangium sp. s54d21]
MANPGAFDKDFGYLMPFLDKVAAAASELTDPVAREELIQLIAEEKVRWERARELLRGASGSAAPPSPSTSAAAPLLARSSADGINRVAPLTTGLTVGSLKQSR